MSTIANPIASPSGSPAASSSSPTGAAATDPLANESTFLTLLVSQLQNQDPLDPVDSNQFISQLTGYSQLEQLIGIHSDTTSLATGTAAASGSTPATPEATADVAAAGSASMLRAAVPTENQLKLIQTGVN
jgi:flagellar basal-body rod modification protein FlgD